MLPFFFLFLSLFLFFGGGGAYRKVQTPNHYTPRELLEMVLNTFGEMSREELDQEGRSRGKAEVQDACLGVSRLQLL